MLPARPRHAKRLLNQLRLSLAVAFERGLLHGPDALDPRLLGRWVALRERWPALARAAAADPACLRSLEAAAEDEKAFAALAAEALPIEADVGPLRRFLAAGPAIGPFAGALGALLAPSALSPAASEPEAAG